MKGRSSELECNLCISDKINSRGFHGVTYAQTIRNTEDFVGSALVEFTISPLDSRSPGANDTARSPPRAEKSRKECGGS